MDRIQYAVSGSWRKDTVSNPKPDASKEGEMVVGIILVVILSFTMGYLAPDVPEFGGKFVFFVPSTGGMITLVIWIASSIYRSNIEVLERVSESGMKPDFVIYQGERVKIMTLNKLSVTVQTETGELKTIILSDFNSENLWVLGIEEK